MRKLWTLLVALGCSCAGVQVPKEKLQDPGALLFNGYTRPDIDCYHCHNGDGTGTVRGPNLAKEVPTMSDAQITHIIREGAGIMPAFKDKLSPDEFTQIVAWLHNSFPAQPNLQPTGTAPASTETPAPK
jgi:mono/diheme cytochrome c family protein